jgi:hypothetical protein
MSDFISPVSTRADSCQDLLLIHSAALAFQKTGSYHFLIDFFVTCLYEGQAKGGPAPFSLK